MSEEEKKAIDLLKHCQNTYIEDTKVTKVELTTKEAETILNLIEKQQKEIEVLKLVHETYKEEIKSIEDRYISKDKIKEEIEKREKQKEEVPHEMDFQAFYRIRDLKEIEIGALKQLLEE